MTRMFDHLTIAPIVLPLVAGAVLLLLDERRRVAKAAISLASACALVGIAVLLLIQADAAGGTGTISVYRLGDWPAPFAIVLVADRLSATMLLLTSLLASAALMFSLARWQRAGPHFHSLFQFLLMGLNGAFLTGDLFNLFVFFELLLAASYGLALHGTGIARVKAGLHYIAMNLLASLMFLVGVSLIYAVTGTLNMADLAARIPDLPSEYRPLFEAGAAILGTAFLLKAGMWPLCFWLPTTYAAAAAPVASVFAIMTKVGVYVVLRLWLLGFGSHASEAGQAGGEILLYGGIATVVFGAIGTLASQDNARLAAFSVLISSGTILAAIGIGQVGVTGGALYYLVSSTLGIGAFFLLIELIERSREPGADVLAVTREAYGEGDEALPEDDEAGVTIPAAMGMLGFSFLGCALILAGLPPLSGFVAKFALLNAALNPAGAIPGGSPVGPARWLYVTVLMVSGLAALIAMVRAGINIFWIPGEQRLPRIRAIEMIPIVVLLLLCVAQTVQAGPVMRFMNMTAEALHAPADYRNRVLEPAATAPMQKRGTP